MRRVELLGFPAIILVGSLCFYYGQNITYKEQWPLYQALRNTSAIIFGVMGAWIAIICPGVLSNIFDSSQSKLETASIKTIKKLIAPMLYSTSILAIVLVIGIFIPILSQSSFFLKHYKIVQGASYALLGVLTIIQLWALILTLLPSDLVISHLEQYKQKVDMIRRLMGKGPPGN